MTNRYVAWTLLIAACGLQAYLVHQGARYFVERESFLSFWYGLSTHLPKQYEDVPFPVVAILTLALPYCSMFLSWVFLGLRRRSGWTLSLAVDLFFALPTFILISINLAQNLRFHHLGMQNNPEVLLFVLALLHILVLCSPPIRTLIFSRPAIQPFDNDSTLPVASAR